VQGLAAKELLDEEELQGPAAKKLQGPAAKSQGPAANVSNISSVSLSSSGSAGFSVRAFLRSDSSSDEEAT